MDKYTCIPCFRHTPRHRRAARGSFHSPTRDFYFHRGRVKTVICREDGERVHLLNETFDSLRADLEAGGARFFPFDPSNADPQDRR